MSRLQVFILLCLSSMALLLNGCSDDYTKENYDANPLCNNGQLDENEACDGELFNNATCLDFQDPLGRNFNTGSLACSDDCSAIITDQCSYQAACNNEILDDGEKCDGINFNGKTCADFTDAGGRPFTDGTLTCGDACGAISTDNCVSTCGNNEIDEGEACDGTNFDGNSCANYIAEGTLSYNDGVLKCSADCTEILTNQCGYKATCNNNILEPGEACDGLKFRDKSCADFKDDQERTFNSGTLSCNSTCTDVTTKNCRFSDPPTCGNGSINTGETCDNTDFGGKTCADFTNTNGENFTDGDLNCDAVSCTIITDNCTYTPPATTRKPIITEYIEGHHEDKAIEIHNPSGQKQYCTLKLYRNGKLSHDTNRTINFEIDPQTVLAICSKERLNNVNCDIHFNKLDHSGNDPYGLECADTSSGSKTLVDSIGQTGVDKEFGTVAVLRRDCDAQNDTDLTDRFVDGDWVKQRNLTFADLGKDSCTRQH